MDMLDDGNSTADDIILGTVKAYIKENHFQELEAVLLAEDSTCHYSVSLHAMSLFEKSVDIGEELLARPQQVLNLFDKAMVSTSHDIYQNHESKEKMCLKQHLHARLTALPLCAEIQRATIPKAADVGKFMCITGTVIRSTSVKLLEYQRQYTCNKCKHVFTVEADVEQHFILPKPARCPNPDGCGGNKFSPLNRDTDRFDVTEVDVDSAHCDVDTDRFIVTEVDVDSAHCDVDTDRFAVTEVDVDSIHYDVDTDRFAVTEVDVDSGQCDVNTDRFIVTEVDVGSANCDVDTDRFVITEVDVGSARGTDLDGLIITEMDVDSASDTNFTNVTSFRNAIKTACEVYASLEDTFI
ncbi:DNA helicase MCM9-like [Limulus polyphemus]|uniref:DNA helicase n=1 Tax=Limulus polyphemus TaxID=6850 RepID=A0ABM1SN73_LIMPO|nr:DNA helicase MCM9-like [Limulus polyphemus]